MRRFLSTFPPPRGTKQIQLKAQIAQLVEQLAFNQLVLGSSPSLRTFSLLNTSASSHRAQRIFFTLKHSSSAEGFRTAEILLRFGHSS